MNSVNLEHLFPPSSVYRIAVCLSAQPRHWRTAVENIKQFFEYPDGYLHPIYNIPVVTDYFIHVWDINTWRHPKQGHEHFYIKEHSDKDAIEAAYAPKAMIHEKWNPNTFVRAWDSMFYSHSRSLLLKREYELTNNIQYDMVVKSRFDTVYNPRHKMPLSRLSPKTCYSPHISMMPIEFNYNNFDDVVFYGDSPTMDLVGDLYAGFNALWNTHQGVDKDVTRCYGPGCLLYHHMVTMGIHPEMRPTFDYAIVRSTAVDENLDGIKDYDTIRQKWFDWYI